MLLPRGNRKTSLSAALAQLHTFGPERKPGGQVLFAAQDRKQAGVAFREALALVQGDRALLSKLRIYDAHNSAKRIVYRPADVTLDVISSDAGSAHGLTSNFVLADELHGWPNERLYEALTSGLDKMDDGLLVIATTAGRGQDNICWRKIDEARKIARGEVDDPSILPILFEAEEGCDWKDEALWRRVNPGMSHGYPPLNAFRRRAQMATRDPGELDSFLQLKLNVWRDSSASPFVHMSLYDEGADGIDEEELKGRPCWLGVDLSAGGDLSAVVAAWQTDEGGYIVKPWFWAPEDTLEERERLSGSPYQRWATEGFLTALPNDYVDHREIERHIRELCATYDVRQIGFDPALAGMVMSNLLDDGLPAVQVRQGSQSIMPAIDVLGRAIRGRKFQHGGHPVLRMCFANAEVQRNTQDHQVRFLKANRHRAIDGAVAASMAVRLAEVAEDNRSFLDDPNIRAEDLVW